MLKTGNRCLLVLVFALGSWMVNGQSVNPFELIPRLGTVVMDTMAVNPVEDTSSAATPPATTLPITSTTTAASSNPFDIVREPSSTVSSHTKPVSPQTPEVISPKPTSSTAKPRLLPRHTTPDSRTASLFFGTLMGICVLLTLLFILFRTSFSQAVQAFFNDNELNKLYRGQNSLLLSSLLPWYVFFWVAAGVFVFASFNYFQIGFSGSYVPDLLYCIGIVSGLLLTKHLVLNLLGNIFPIDKEVRLYNFTIMVFGIVTGVLLVIATILVSYGPQNLTLYFIYGSLILLALIYLFRSLRGMFVANRFLAFHKFHFLLYICTVEIAPVFIVLKLGLLYLGR